MTDDDADLATHSPLAKSARRAGADALVVEVAGEVDLHNSPALRDDLLGLLDRAKPKRLVLDMSGVPFVDSSAIAVLVETLRKAREHGGTVALAAPSKRVLTVLGIARLETIFVVKPSVDEALRA